MAISFVAAGTVIQSTNPVVPVPTGYAAGDILIIFITAGAATTPTGWTLINQWITGGPVSLFYKVASASESSVSIASSNPATVAGMVAYRGASGIDVKMTVSNTATGTTTVSTSSITTTATNDYVISIFIVVAGVNTWTAPASTTTRVNSASTATFRGVLLVDELQASAGATTVRTGTLATSSTSSAYSFSLKESTSTNKGSFFFIM